MGNGGSSLCVTEIDSQVSCKFKRGSSTVNTMIYSRLLDLNKDNYPRRNVELMITLLLVPLDRTANTAELYVVNHRECITMNNTCRTSTV